MVNPIDLKSNKRKCTCECVDSLFVSSFIVMCSCWSITEYVVYSAVTELLMREHVTLFLNKLD